MNRRKTLATSTVHNIQDNGANGQPRAGARSRMSCAMGNQESRPSLSTNQNARPSQTKANSRGKQDPRDAQDKTYQKEAKQNVIAFLTKERYPHEVSPKKLTSVSQKEFYQMFAFIVRYLDSGMPEELPPNADSAELVITYLKWLKYPFVYPKSCLQAVGSPIYWPQILASLDWLVGQVLYLQERDRLDAVEEAQRASRGSSVATASHFQQRGVDPRMQMYAEGYVKYMNGDEQGAEFDAALRGHYALLRAESEAECTKILQRIEDLGATMQSLRDSPDEASSLAREIEEIRAGHREVLQATADNEAAIVQLEEQLSAKRRELGQQEAKLETLIAEEKDLKERVAAQPVQKEEVLRLQEELASLREAKRSRDEFSARRKETRKLHEKAWAQGLKDLESLVLDFNEKLGELKLVPATSKRANGINYALAVNHTGRTIEEILPGDVKAKIAPALAQVQEHYLNKKRLREQQLQFLRERISDTHRAAAQLQASGRPEQHALEAVQSRARESNEACEQEVQAMYEEAARMQDEARTMLEVADRALVESKAALEHELQAFKNAHRAGQETLGGTIRQVHEVLDQIISHKGRMKEMSDAFAQAARDESARLQRIHADNAALIRDLVPGGLASTSTVS